MDEKYNSDPFDNNEKDSQGNNIPIMGEPLSPTSPGGGVSLRKIIRGGPAALGITGFCLLLTAGIVFLLPNTPLVSRFFPSIAKAHAIQTTITNANSQWEPLLSDTFDNNKNQWYEGVEDDEDATITYAVTDGKYRWDTTARDYTIKRVLLEKPVSDFYFASDIQNNDGAAGAGDYGIIFREDDNGNFYYFAVEIDGNDCTLLQFYNGELSDLMEWTDCTPIVPKGSNKLAVIGEGDHIILLINNRLVDDFRDDSIKGNRIGLAIRIYADFDAGAFEFDNLELKVP